MKYRIHNNWLLLGYLFLYASIVTGLTRLFEYAPVSLQMEYAVYDPMQEYLTIDREVDKRFQQYQYQLTDICAIHLDHNYFDSETERVRRKELAQLLQFLATRPEIKAVFLDYLFAPKYEKDPLNSIENQLLIKGIKALENKLVLPYTLESDTLFFNDSLIIPNTKRPDTLFYYPKHTGFLTTIQLVAEEKTRYSPLKTDDDSLVSAIHKLVELVSGHNKKQFLEHSPNRIETNYLLRNQAISYERAMPIHDASAIVQYSKNQLKEAIAGKVVFIGSYKEVNTKYGKSFDKFATPVQAKMNGIYININNFLNIISQSYIRRINWKIVFLVNFFLALGGIKYYQTFGSKAYKAPWIQILEIILSISIWLGLLFFFYDHFHLKFPFVFTTIFYIRNQYWFHLYSDKLKLN